MTVDGDDGDTTVVARNDGAGHSYCTFPTAAAAGHHQDTITITLSPATCPGFGSHQLHDTTYEVRYRNYKSFNSNGISWAFISGSGCYSTANASTTSTPGTIEVVNGSGSWVGQLGPLKGTPYYSISPLEAAHLCVYDPASHTGMIAPYRLLLI